MSDLAVAKKDQKFVFLGEPEWFDDVEEHAKRWGMTKAAYIRLAVNEKMERDDASPAPRRQSRPRSRN